MGLKRGLGWPFGGRAPHLREGNVASSRSIRQPPNRPPNRSRVHPFMPGEISCAMNIARVLAGLLEQIMMRWEASGGGKPASWAPSYAGRPGTVNSAGWIPDHVRYDESAMTRLQFGVKRSHALSSVDFPAVFHHASPCLHLRHGCPLSRVACLIQESQKARESRPAP